MADDNAQPGPEQSPDWWRGCVIYQIYPRSFQDTTGDGSVLTWTAGVPPQETTPEQATTSSEA